MNLLVKFNELDPKSKTIIQILLAIPIVLLFQFVIPMAWQPSIAMVGDVFGAEGGVLLAGLSIWYFAISIPWVLYRDNPYLNSFFIYSVIPLGVILVLEFSFYFLFWDFIHLLPFIISLFIIWKKRDTLRQKWILIVTAILTGWLLLAYFLGLAYTNIPLFMFLLGMVIYVSVMIRISFFSRGATQPKKGIIKKILRGFLIGLWMFGVFLGSVLLYWYLRPSALDVNQELVLESWLAVEGLHNSNTDMISWNGSIYLAHDRRIYHPGHPDAKLIIWKSNDARSWTKVTEFTIGEDIRDPKFAIINDSLFLYALKNQDFFARPYQTVYTYTEDGILWHSLTELEVKGWLFWRPKTYNNNTWYVPAYWHEHGKAALFNSTDGINWTLVATIHEGDAIDETAIEFLYNGTMICTGRLEGSADNMFGSPDAATLIATSPYPYENWTSFVKSTVTRLDGPCLFSYDNKTFAVGRRQIGPMTIFTQLGGAFSRKRTSIFLVEEDGLTHLTDLPSAGDTSYAGVVINETEAYISYYTSDFTKDYPWILGMFADSEIWIAWINLTELVSVAETIG